MMFKKKLFLFLLVILNFQTNLMSEVYIAYKINNEIITNLDINKETRYLTALNNQLKNLDNNQIKKIAQESLIREKIKKIELSKVFKFDQKNPFLDTVIEDFYLRLNLGSKKEFKEYLKDYDITIREIKKKIEIETLWNQLIFDKFKKQLYINEEKIKNKIDNNKKLKIERNYLLSEIIFEKIDNQTLNQSAKTIIKSINEIGFENSANIFSLSDSSKFGGNIGWIKEKSLSENIFKEISSLKNGSYTDPIQVGSNMLILKLNNTKDEKIAINYKDELKKMIAFEQDRQLNKFSKIYYNRIKINIDVEKF